jgi:hypothetical protein
MKYHVLMAKNRKDIMKALQNAGSITINIEGTNVIIETDRPEECQKIADDFNYKLVFANPKNYSDQLIIK